MNLEQIENYTRNKLFHKYIQWDVRAEEIEDIVWLSIKGRLYYEDSTIRFGNKVILYLAGSPTEDVTIRHNIDASILSIARGLGSTLVKGEFPDGM